MADAANAACAPGLHEDLRGRAVVLIHEFGGGPANVEPVSALLREWGALVLTPVLPGHATRWEDLTEVTWLDWCRAGEAAVQEAARHTGQPVVIAGVSVGSALALRIAATLSAQVGAVVAINATLQSNSRLLPLVPILRFVIRSIPTQPDRSLPQTYSRLPTKVLTQLRPLWRDVARRLGSIEQPVLILRSQSDGQSGTLAAAQIRNAVASRHVAEVVLPQAGHVATVGADVLSVAQAIADVASAQPSGPTHSTATESRSRRNQ